MFVDDVFIYVGKHADPLPSAHAKCIPMLLFDSRPTYDRSRKTRSRRSFLLLFCCRVQSQDDSYLFAEFWKRQFYEAGANSSVLPQRPLSAVADLSHPLAGLLFFVEAFVSQNASAPDHSPFTVSSHRSSSSLDPTGYTNASSYCPSHHPALFCLPSEAEPPASAIRPRTTMVIVNAVCLATAAEIQPTPPTAPRTTLLATLPARTLPADERPLIQVNSDDLEMSVFSISPFDGECVGIRFILPQQLLAAESFQKVSLTLCRFHESKATRLPHRQGSHSQHYEDHGSSQKYPSPLRRSRRRFCLWYLGL